MRLQRLVLSGFKTFAHRTEIRFEPGITGVVGPNGSGKSNLVDAVRWALGETNARELRGSRLDEMIYAGGAGRDRMGIAEVELVLDNEDGALPVEDAEVALGRRVVRGGDVEYRINGERARLRDVERLLGGTGLTQHGYAVVAQHDIEAIIEATPRQRRSLVEQAAGVRPLRVACDDAQRRLEQVGTAVQRLADRLGESEPRLEQLAGEREAALEQRGMAERLSALRGSLAREAWRAARAESRQARRRLETAERRLEAATEAEEGYAERADAARAGLEAARAAGHAAGERLEAARVAAERCRGEARRFGDRAWTAALHRADARRQSRAAAVEIEAAGRALDELAGPGLAAQERLRELEAVAAELATRSRAAAAEAAGAQRALDEAEREVVRAAAAAAGARAGARDRAENRDLLEKSFEAAGGELASARGRAADLEAAARAARAHLAELDAAVGVADAQTTRCAAELETARHLLREAEARRVEERERTTRALARAASLHGQVEGLLGGSGAIGARAEELGAVRLVDALRVLDPVDAAAVEAALEPHLGAWVVGDVDRALELLRGADVREEVLSEGAGVGGAAGATVAARQESADAGGGAEPSASPAARPALEAVEVEPRARAAAAHCLAGTWLVADLATARRVVATAGGRAVLPDGAVITAAGARAGGGSAPTLSLVAAAREAQTAAESATAQEAAAETELRRRSEAVAGADVALARASAELTARRRELADGTAQAAAAGIAAAMESRRLPALEAELGRRAQARASAAAAAESAALEADRAGRGQEDLGAAAEQARTRHAQLRDRSEEIATELGRVEAELAEGRAVAEEAERRRAESERRRRDAAARLAESDARVAAAETDALVALAHGGAAGAAARAAEAAEAEAAALLAELSRPIGAMEAALNTLETERGEVRVAVARAEDEVNAARSEVAVAEMRLAEQADAVRGQVDEETAELDPAAAERAEREIARLERRIAAMGPVNALAPEQYTLLEERVDRLRVDRDDLAVASAEVTHLIRRFEVEASRRFDAVFGAVNAHFAELFTELFPGGRAALRLEAPPEPAPGSEAGAEAAGAPGRAEEELLGVAILAQPAGKRLQPLTHLSGGERALTALAVVFALQQVNPSPFYIFDEVDAPLDDTSVLRFTRLLSRLAAVQQFIVVTHNHVTMAAADALYGVTIDRDGVSSLLSVRFASDVVAADVTGTLVSPLRRVAS